MIRSRCLCCVCSLLLAAVGIGRPMAVHPRDAMQSPAGREALRIVVLEGEGAVNIIQQKTAVAPVVEVRDRNDQPVAGAIMRFAVTRGRATLAGARTLTVATDAAGRAAVSSLVPSGAGSLQISATAAFQGQTAAVTIAQTNVMTAAQAAAVSAAAGGTSSGSAGGSAAGAAGGGGGLSTTTLVVAGAAAAGGAVAATKVLGGGDDYSGPLNFTMNLRSSVVTATCSEVVSFTSTLRMTLTVEGTDVSGKASWSGRMNVVSTTCVGPGARAAGFSQNYGWGQFDPSVGGSTSRMTFHHEFSNRTDPQTANCADCAQIWDFVGALNGNTITGTVDFTQLSNGITLGQVRIPVNITKQ